LKLHGALYKIKFKLYNYEYDRIAGGLYMRKLLKEFRTFALKGNVVDLAIGVIIGSAFGKIVTSLVNDIVMPLLGLVLGNVVLRDQVVTLAGSGDDALVLNYGNFLQSILDFTIIAFSIFLMISMINRMRKRFEKQKEETPAAPAAPNRSEALLEEIRDLLRK
jgi:large conductance mechanosensitive channel